MKQIILNIFLIFSVFISAQTTDAVGRKKNYNLTNNGLALEGYDPVSYFLRNPKKGTEGLNYEYNGVTYYFTSQANLDLFKKSPTKFEPAYGGWCAYAMGATGEKVEIDPKTYKIIDNKLYLFYNAYFNNTLPKWNKDEINLKNKANKNWLNYYI